MALKRKSVSEKNKILCWQAFQTTKSFTFRKGQQKIDKYKRHVKGKRNAAVENNSGALRFWNKTKTNLVIFESLQMGSV